MPAPLFPDPDLADKMRAKGHHVETVGDILGDAPKGPPRGFEPAVLDGTPRLPSPGIYFGMSDEDYHALPALSNSGIKKLSASPMIFWASTPWLCQRKRDEMNEAEEKAHHIFGKAYHCRLMEGASVFALRYAIALDPADCEGCLESTEQIKAAIGKFEAEAFDRKGDSKGMQPVKPVSKVKDIMPDGVTEYERSAVKSDWIAQLMALDPEAPVFAIMQERHRAENAGKVFLSADQFAELEIAAAMIERDPEGRTAFVEGYAEVVLIWYCPTTGVPMKAKVDYLKLAEMVDLKSIGNTHEKSIEAAIATAIATYRYNIQPIVYFEGAEVVRKLVREHGAAAVRVVNEDGSLLGLTSDDPHWLFAEKWAKQQDPDKWLWVFQQKGIAPITRGVWFPRGGVTDEATRWMVERAKKLFLRHSEVFGTEPWLDVAPFYMIDDESIPRWATEI